MDLVNNLFKRPATSLAMIAGICFGSQTANAEWPKFVSTRFFEAEKTPDDVVIRGQSDPFYTIPVGVSPIPAISGEPVYQQAQADPQMSAPTASADPFLSGQFAPPPASFDPFGPQQTYGINGPQPYRFGWKEQLDWAIAPSQGTDPNVGSFAWSELNYTKEWNGRGAQGGIWTFNPQVNVRWLEGPDGAGAAALPGDLYRFGLGMKYATQQSPNGVSFEFGFNPAIATDFNQSLTDDAWQFDAHLVSFWRTSPSWMWVLGVTYWDRGEDFILPYAGAVWTPNDMFEARLLFPKARLEWFLGTPYGVPTWLYTTAEYHVESYEIGFQPPTVTPPHSSAMQIEDWRIMGGMRWETGWLETYAEAGVLFDRKVDFNVGGPDFDPDTAFMARVGLKF